MFLSLYTEKAKGILTEQRFVKLTAALEQEQELSLIHICVRCLSTTRRSLSRSGIVSFAYIQSPLSQMCIRDRCTACHVAESHNEVLAQENTVNGGYTITDITDPVEVQSYIEQQGGEYTADIMAVHQVTFTDYTVNDITDPAEIKAYLESQGQEYNENITAIHQITFIDGEATPEGSLCEVEK